MSVEVPWNADGIEEGGAQRNKNLAIVEESGDAASAHSTTKWILEYLDGQEGGSHMLVIEDLRTMEPVRVCSPAALGAEGGDGSRKRGAPRGTGVVGKKVKFFSEIMIRVYPRDNEDASAEEAIQSDKANTVAPQTVVSAGGNGTSGEGVGSGQMQYPPGYQPGRQLSNAEKGKTPVVQEDPIVEAIRRAIMGGGPMIHEGGQ